jgi:hypothetical protein
MIEPAARTTRESVVRLARSLNHGLSELGNLKGWGEKPFVQHRRMGTLRFRETASRFSKLRS